jgi:hypothetical protein
MARTSKTLIYAPEIQVLISTNQGVIDVSDDIVNFQVRRVLNAASQFACVLNNRNQKYTGKLGRMDRVVVFLKRVQKLQVFSGYLDSVPGLSLYTNTCEIRATCTLKRLINTWWDAGLAESQELLMQSKWDGNNSAGDDPNNRDSDSGLGTMLGNVLTQVAGWNPDDIYIQNIPAEFMKLGLEVAAKEEQKEQIELLKKMLGVTSGNGFVDTTGTLSGGTVPITIAAIGDYQENFESDSFTAKFTGPYPAGGAVERWRPLAMLALQQMSVDASVIDIMMRRIGVESTGNPNAINLTDSNAQKGTPSMGILQCIESTFRANAVAPYNQHIYSPFGSMLASLQYVKKRYNGDFNRAYGGTAGY